MNTYKTKRKRVIHTTWKNAEVMLDVDKVLEIFANRYVEHKDRWESLWVCFGEIWRDNGWKHWSIYIDMMGRWCKVVGCIGNKTTLIVPIIWKVWFQICVVSGESSYWVIITNGKEFCAQNM